MIIYLDPLLDLHHVLQDEWWYSHLIAQHPQTELFQSGWPMRASWSYFLYTNSLDDCLFNATASGLLGFTPISIPPFKLINIAASLSLSKEGVGPLFSICSNEKTLIQIFKVMLNISNTLVLSQVSSLKQKFILFFRKVFNSPCRYVTKESELARNLYGTFRNSQSALLHIFSGLKSQQKCYHLTYFRIISSNCLTKIPSICNICLLLIKSSALRSFVIFTTWISFITLFSILTSYTKIYLANFTSQLFFPYFAKIVAFIISLQDCKPGMFPQKHKCTLWI